MSKKIKTSRWWYNFKDSVKFHLTLRDPDPHEGDKLMNDMIEGTACGTARDVP